MNLEMDRSEIPDHLLEFFETIVPLPAKSLQMIPFRVALALQADGWYLRSVIPWVKRNPMPESVTDRPASAVEYLFLLSKSARYHWDGEAIRQPAEYGRRESTGAMWDGQRRADYRDDRAGGKRTVFGADPSAGRSYRNSDAFFQSWQGLLCDEDGDPMALVVNPAAFSGSHFATFPLKLVEPFIKAGTSEKGACPACGAPWVRVVERSRTYESNASKAGNFSLNGKGHPTDQIRPDHDIRHGPVGHAKTLGWEPSCRCDAGDPVPCVVLDPFLGSGTTLLVADRLGRSGIGCDLNPEYVEMARKRIDQDAGPMLAAPVTVEAPVQLRMEEAG